MVFSRRPGERFNRGRIQQQPSNGWTAPTVPVANKTAVFFWGSDVVSAGTWAPRRDTLGVGNMTGVSTTIETTAQGAYQSMRLTRASSSYLQLDNLAPYFVADDFDGEMFLVYENVAAAGAANTLFAAATAAGTTFKRTLDYTAGAYRYIGQASILNYSHNANNTNLHLLRIRWKNNGAGQDITIWRDEEPDPISGFWGSGTLTQNIGAQTGLTKFTIGALWNAGAPVNFNDMRVVGFGFRDPAAAPYTDAEGVDIFNWVLGAQGTAPLYNDTSTQYLLLVGGGQSNCVLQGLGTGAVSGMPDASAKVFLRNLNNDADNPSALSALNLRPGANSYSSSMQWMPSGSFAIQHHFCGVGKGATSAGSDWGGNNGAGPANILQGLLSTDLYSEVRRNIFLSKARFGGAPIVQILWGQGENDAAAGSVVAGQYGTNFGSGTINILLYFRKIIERVWGVANAPCHAQQLSPNQTGGGIVLADLNTIRAAMVTLTGTVTALYIVETNDITNLNADNLHYKNAANSYGLIASRYIASIKASDVRL